MKIRNKGFRASNQKTNPINKFRVRQRCAKKNSVTKNNPMHHRKSLHVGVTHHPQQSACTSHATSLAPAVANV